MLNINKLNRLNRVAYFPTALGMLLLIASVSLQAGVITQQ
jgi:hypothetical protein